MPRRLRFAPPGYWLHLAQRGNNKQPVYSTDADRQHFLQLVETRSEQREVRIAAYTLMTNHFHLVAAGDRTDAISLFMMDLNGQYATYRNATRRTTGHVWQNRFYSCVLDDAHWETALRYVELNAVRARIAKSPADYRWSSAKAHLGLTQTSPWLDTDQFQRTWPTPAAWKKSLITLIRRQVAAIRSATQHDSALGSDFSSTTWSTHIRFSSEPSPSAGPAKSRPAKQPWLAVLPHALPAPKGGRRLVYLRNISAKVAEISAADFEDTAPSLRTILVNETARDWSSAICPALV